MLVTRLLPLRDLWNSRAGLDTRLLGRVRSRCRADTLPRLCAGNCPFDRDAVLFIRTICPALAPRLPGVVPLSETLFHSSRQWSSIRDVWSADGGRTPDWRSAAGSSHRGGTPIAWAIPSSLDPSHAGIYVPRAGRDAMTRLRPGGSRREEDALDETLIGGAVRFAARAASWFSPTKLENQRRPDEIDEDQRSVLRVARHRAVVALMLAAWAGRCAGPRRLGHGIGDEVRLRHGHRQEGDAARRSSSAASTC